MSSTLEEVNGNGFVKNEEEKAKDSGTIAIEDGVVVSDSDLNAPSNLKFDFDGRTKIFSQPNGVNDDKEQELDFILAEHERVKDELGKVQTDYKRSLQREKDLCDEVHKYHEEKNAKDADLCQVNGELKEQLKKALEELNSHKDELRRLVYCT